MDSKKVKELLVKYVAGGYNSFNSIESSFLKDLVQFGVELGYKYGNIDLDNLWPSRSTVRSATFDIVEKHKKEILEELKESSKSSSLSVTTDIWSDGVVRQAYIDVSVFYIYEWKLKHALLAFRHFEESHTGAAIFSKIQQVANEFGFDSLTSPYVTDSAANMKAAFRNGEWYPCMCHRLHTIVKDSWNQLLSSDFEISLMFERMMNVRRSVHHSVGLEAQLPKKLPNDSPTRFWMGLSALFGAFVVSFEKINEIFEEHQDISPPSDKRLMQNVLTALETFDFAFQNMQSATMPTLHLAILNLAKIELAITGWLSRMKTFGQIVIGNLTKKWVSEINAGHILSPLQDAINVKASISAVEQSIALNYQQDAINDTSSGEIQAIPEVNADPFMDQIDHQATAKDNLLNKSSTLDEYDLYLKETISRRFENPLEYWKDSQHKKLSKVACSIFCIPCSSAEPERHNSAAGKTITALRNRLKPEIVEALVIINESIKNSI